MRIAVAGGTGTAGRAVVELARGRGHEVVALARSVGTDLVTGNGLRDALAGADAVVDVSSVHASSGSASRDFFDAATRHLLDAERAAGVGHHVALGIVGSDRAPFGYYAGKALQERLVTDGPVPWTILRATQFHDFARQIYGSTRIGPLVVIPTMRSQPVAVREVGERLVDLVEAGPAGRVPDLAGPRAERMVEMVRAYAKATDRHDLIVEAPIPGGFGRAMRDGTLLPGEDAVLGVQTYAQWVAGLVA